MKIIKFYNEHSPYLKSLMKRILIPYFDTLDALSSMKK